MAGARTFVVRFLADADQYKKGIKQVNDGMGGLKTQVSSLLPSFKTMAIAGAAAFGAVAAFAGKAVQAAMEDEKSQALLAKQLRTTFGASDQLIDSTERLIAAQQLLTGESDTNLRAALGGLTRATGDYNKATGLLSLAQDIASATGADLTAVSISLGKASLGNFTALKKLGVPIDENVVKSKDFQAVLESLTATFGGAASTAANTFGGRLKIVRGQFGEIVETIGASLLPYLDQFAKFLTDKVAPAVQRITTVIGEDGLIAGFQQLLFESGRSGTGLVDVFRNIAVAAATTANVIYRGFYIAKAQIDLLVNPSAVISDLGKAFGDSAIDVDALKKSFASIAMPVNRFKTELITADQAERNFNKTGKTTADTFGDTGGVAKAVKDATAKLKVYTDALSTSNSAQRTFTNAQKASVQAGQSLTDANQGVADSQAALDAAIAGFGADSPQAKAAAKDLELAQRGLERANIGVEKSIQNVKDAEQNLADVRAKGGADPRSIREAEIGVAKAKQNQASSLQAVADAEKELERVRRRGRSTPEQLLAAETNLANAKFNVEEAVFGVTDAEKGLSDLRSMKGATPEEIRDAEIELAEAKLANADAVDAQAEATDGLNKKQGLLTEAISGALPDSETYKTLTQQLKDAKVAQATATDAVTEAILDEADAFIALKDAIEAAGKVAALYPKITGVFNVNNPMAGSANTIPATVTGNSTGFNQNPSGGGLVVNVNAGLVSSPATVSQDIIDLLTDYGRVNGVLSFGTLFGQTR
jgi:hypothetical protein